jgi:AcrR family transcriptional regulator
VPDAAPLVAGPGQAASPARSPCAVPRDGYEATAVEQIAEAAEIAVSTFFRYFPAKEDLVLTDDYDPLIIEAFREQPPGLGPVEAVRRALRAVFAGLGGDEMADMRERAMLALAVPELRAAMLD